MPFSSTRIQGYAYGTLSSLCFAIMSYIVYKLENSFSSHELVFYRSIIGLIILTPFVSKDIYKLFNKKSVSIWLRSFAGAISVECYFWTLQASDVGTARVLADISPVFVLIFSVTIFKENISKIELIGFGTCIISVTILNLYKSYLIGFNQSLFITCIGLLGSLAAGISLTSLKRATLNFSMNIIVWNFCFITAIVSLLLTNGHFSTFKNIKIIPIVFIALLGLVGQVFRTYSYARLKASLASILALLTLCFGVLCQSIFDKKDISATEVAAYILIIIGSLFMNKQFIKYFLKINNSK